VKTLLPAALLPGWFLMVATPFYLLLAVVALIPLNHLAGSPFLVLGVLFWIGAPMWYVWRADLFVRPLQATECPALDRVQWLAALTGLVGAGLLATYLFTKEVFGLRLMGFEASTSLVWLWENRSQAPLAPGEAIRQARSLFWIGDISVSQLFIQYLGRSLFMTAVFADLLVRMTLSVWKQEKEFEQTPAHGQHNATLADLKRSLDRERPPPA